MDIGLGLPISEPESLLAWARRAEAGPFTTLGLLDRLAYDNPEPMVTLAAILGATSRLRVQTEVLITPLRDPVLLAKQGATLDRIAPGRFVLGLGIGGRDEDYRAAGVDFRGRGRRLDQQMAIMRSVWTGEPRGAGVGPIGPVPARAGGPEVLFGAFVPPGAERVAKWGDGFLGAGPLEGTDRLFRIVERSWQEAGRAGRPRLVAQVNVAFGPDDVVAQARAAIRAYYAGSDYTEFAERILTTREQVRSAITAFGDIGATEIMLYCWSSNMDQIQYLADAVT